MRHRITSFRQLKKHVPFGHINYLNHRESQNKSCIKFNSGRFWNSGPGRSARSFPSLPSERRPQLVLGALAHPLPLGVETLAGTVHLSAS